MIWQFNLTEKLYFSQKNEIFEAVFYYIRWCSEIKSRIYLMDT